MEMSGHGQGFLPYMSNSLAIRQEIQRFESVHPSIYAIYDLIELVPDPLLAQQIREHVVCIEDSFVNSQEWTISRAVPDLRLGIVGSLSSGKSALVHRYLTGSYMQEESPEGGRFKKEVVVDGQSYLLLIRDEGGPPELQFTSWVDAVIFVFSLENEASFNAIYNYYAKMAQLRNIQDIPLILVGTQDCITESNPRVVEDSRARKLADDLNLFVYYETCATYGLNVERVFQSACQKICHGRSGSRPTTPNHFNHRPYPGYGAGHTNGFVPQGGVPVLPHTQGAVPVLPSQGAVPVLPSHSPDSFLHSSAGVLVHSPPSNLVPHLNMSKETRHSQSATSVIINPVSGHDGRNRGAKELRNQMNNSGSGSGSEGNSKFLVPENGGEKEERGELPTPSSTPTTSRKNRRRSNLFTPSGKGKSEEKRPVVIGSAGEVGSGRSIPLRQGYLYKKSNKSFSKEWKKKYVTLCEGTITYHPSLHDYMENIHGKQISLQYVTVKVPGQGPRGTAVRTVPLMGNGTVTNGVKNSIMTGEKVTLTGYEPLCEASGGEDGQGETKHSGDTPNVKKRHRRMKSAGVKGGQDVEEETFELQIVSLDNKQWHFEAGSAEERDEWVQAVEQQILNCLQGNESSKSKRESGTGTVDQAAITRLRSEVRGNNLCVDCESPNPDWASLNLGVLVCIECSGIHRNLGSHISRVRSLDLDEWPPGHLAVMTSLGNTVVNRLWEGRGRVKKPQPDSSREDKENYIKAKYERKEWLVPLNSPNRPPGSHQSPAQALLDAICRCDIVDVSLALAHSTTEDVNCSVSSRDARTPLHLAAALGNLPITQLLLWANGNVNACDHEGRTCVAHARSSGAMEVVNLLVSAGGKEGVVSSLTGGGTLPRRRGSVQGRSKEVSSSVL